MNTVIGWVNSVLWGGELWSGFAWSGLLMFLLMGAGIYFTIRSRFVQFRSFGLAMNTMLNSRATESDKHVSAFQAFCTSLAARIGTGNMAGVAVAITMGGPGAVFWMWVIALLGMATSLSENILAQLYKTNNHDGTFRGGPAYYIEKALGKRWLGVAFSISLIIAFGFAFNSVQSNSIAAAFNDYDMSKEFIGIVLALVSGVIVFGGIRSISKVAEMIVPVMALGYLLIALTVVILNITQLPDVMVLIVKSAFGLQEVATGGVAYMVSIAMQQGIKRGLFSNEAGMGSAPNAAATPFSAHPVNQGLMGMLGVFADTMVVCTATAAIILMSGVFTPDGPTGIELTQKALESQMGPWGGDLVAIAIFLFAFSSIIANYYYGESNLRFIKDSPWLINIYRLGVMSMVVWGAVSDLPSVWAFADAAMGTMALINLVSIMLLSGIVVKVLRDFDEQVAQGISPVFNRKKYPFLDKTMDEDVWQENAEVMSEPKLV